ncbi:hypothetical protein PIB30_082123 [Stylosanthes scabra]|uniref:Fold protein n=1 Tax=Stylosanthes scabra TaxID=79078 RepID=A0ABU6QT68_9FABA|nr:hypothetical protein [Stylosanthes scabra]
MSTTWLQDLEVEVEEEEEDGGLFHHPHNLSRLSVCTTSSSMCGVEEDAMMMSRLSIDDDDEGDDADGELSGEEQEHVQLSSASDKEDFPCSCSSLPNTPPRARRRKNKVFGVVKQNEKEYASDNGPRDEKRRIRNRNRMRSRRVMSSKSDEDEEGDGSGGRGDGVVLITRPKGGKRTLCMGLEEVKACRELGFELELPQTPPHYPSLDTSSSGANSPISSWRISSPGDDPREVKARLKVWAQAVALASASKYGT